MRARGERWRIWIDTGGTFTDAVAVAPDGRLGRIKFLTSGALRGRVERRLDDRQLVVRESWGAPRGFVDGLRFGLLGGAGPGVVVHAYDPSARRLTLSEPFLDPIGPEAPFEIVSDEPPPLLAARLLTGTPRGRQLPPASLRLATTLGTNALLERTGARVALFITEGFADLLAIGTQQRPDLFALDVRRPAPLCEAVVEVPERLDAAGEIVVPLRAEAVASAARALLARGIRSAAIALAHSYRDGRHERSLRDRLVAWGFDHVSCSSDLAPRIKLLARAETAVVDAHLAPVVAGHLARVGAAVPAGGLLVMTSAGGLVEPSGFRAKDGLLSGPAAGVAGAIAAGRRAGIARLIGFDMGGTSTDVARYDGRLEYVFEHEVGTAHVAAPALAIESVAAGGGSVCWLDGERLSVGPRSAQARPGPACYGAGGPLTVTDVNLLLGRLDPARFEIPIVEEAARLRLEELCAELERATGVRETEEAVLSGLLDIANETMADALRRVSIRRGFDPADYTLVAFGGAGGQHACAVAGQLGVPRVLVPADAALLSATGLGQAVAERFAERQVLEPLDRVRHRLGDWFDELVERARTELRRTGIAPAQMRVRRRLLHLRRAGQDAALEIDWSPRTPIESAFARQYARLFGHRPGPRPIEVESMRVVVSERARRIAADPEPAPHAAVPVGSRRAFVGGGLRDVPVYERAALRAGASLDGPALIFEPRSATVVECGFRARATRGGALLLEGAGDVASSAPDRPEAVRLELFTQRFLALVREMGERLERTAVSTNVKERLDFSCALLDPDGELVVSAPHIPVHLGALGLCVRRLRQAIAMEPGDVVVTNHPAYGGSHLPDVTIVTPVHENAGSRRLLGYVASRAHHADIGGERPGSMPPHATNLAQEGIVIAPTWIVRRGRPRWAAIVRRLRAGAHPARRVDDNLADLRAAVAANHAGADKLRALAGRYGADTLARFMEAIQSLAERRLRGALGRLAPGRHEALERLDDGTPLAVRIDVAGDRARIDFAGSGPVHPGNLNATPAIVRSAVIYVLRLLIPEPLPLNEGLLRAVEIRLAPGLLDPPFDADPERCPAVVGGNVETSQRLVDTLLRALGLAACSQGTMNNVVFGGPDWGYYETLGGGCGAGPGFAGASGVHSHMTNTRITDVEVLEQRFPVRVERFALRRGSGGKGKTCGGEGLVRAIRFLAPASVSVLTQHRVVAPYGAAGGAPGACGRQYVERASGARCELGGIDGCEVGPGDLLVVETPGGGGWGEPAS